MALLKKRKCRPDIVFFASCSDFSRYGKKKQRENNSEALHVTYPLGNPTLFSCSMFYSCCLGLSLLFFFFLFLLFFLNRICVKRASLRRKESLKHIKEVTDIFFPLAKHPFPPLHLTVQAHEHLLSPPKEAKAHEQQQLKQQ